MREIALDTETTGLDPTSGHRIIEIGCVEMRGRIRTGRTFHTYLNPEREVPQEAFAVHGLSTEMLRDKPVFSVMAGALIDFIADSPLIIHNARFDMGFINAELALIGLEPLPFERAVDTVGLARKKFPGAPASLDALCKRFEIDLSARTRHGALLDAELLADVYLELTGGRQAALNLAAERVLQEGALAQRREGWPARMFAPAEEEAEAHRAFIETLKNPLWKKAAG